MRKPSRVVTEDCTIVCLLTSSSFIIYSFISLYTRVCDCVCLYNISLKCWLKSCFRLMWRYKKHAIFMVWIRALMCMYRSHEFIIQSGVELGQALSCWSRYLKRFCSAMHETILGDNTSFIVTITRNFDRLAVYIGNWLIEMRVCIYAKRNSLELGGICCVLVAAASSSERLHGWYT